QQSPDPNSISLKTSSGARCGNYLPIICDSGAVDIQVRVLAGGLILRHASRHTIGTIPSLSSVRKEFPEVH
ncbi:MAG: hypothetical protein WCO86_02285, partial [Planctomycetota bacterium]